MCGTGDINVQDFKAHAVIVGGSWHFREKVRHGRFSYLACFPSSWWKCLILFAFPFSFPQVMKWFWAVVSSFTQEELARLLQFTTGSSQLPHGGFNTLCPSFQIIAAPTHSTLPTAHTWWVEAHILREKHASTVLLCVFLTAAKSCIMSKTNSLLTDDINL